MNMLVDRHYCKLCVPIFGFEILFRIGVINPIDLWRYKMNGLLLQKKESVKRDLGRHMLSI